jgi:hypothetical protein
MTVLWVINIWINSSLEDERVVAGFNGLAIRGSSEVYVLANKSLAVLFCSSEILYKVGIWPK